MKRNYADTVASLLVHVSAIDYISSFFAGHTLPKVQAFKKVTGNSLPRFNFYGNGCHSVNYQINFIPRIIPPKKEIIPFP